MADSARIEELRKRYHENPRRFFAPLANEYRKAGLLDRAVLLCEKHLGEQPENMNGLVVYGQTLFESGQYDDARTPFERALALDPENLIALRHLGDIARVQGDTATAKAWYDRVLEFDRRNDEVLELLEQMGMRPVEESSPAARPPMPMSPLVSVAPSVSVSAAVGIDVAAVDVGAVDVGAVDVEPAAAEVPPSAMPGRRGTLLDVSFDFSDVPQEPIGSAPVPSAPLLGAEAAEYGFADPEPLLPTDGLAPTDGPALEVNDALPPLTVADVPSLADTLPMAPWMPAERPSAPRPRMTKADLASLPLLADFGLEDDPLAPTEEPLSATEPMSIAEPMSAAEPMSIAEPIPARPSQKTPTFATETMATLYLQQGFRDRAIDVYRQLVAQAPHDTALRDKLADLERAMPSAPDAAQEMPEFDEPFGSPDDPALAPANAMLSGMSFAEVGLSVPGAPAEPTALGAMVPSAAAGPSAREFFSIFARRGLAAVATAAAVTVAAPARDSLARTGWPLDALFGAATDVRDLHAAEMLAGISTFAGPGGGTGLDALFMLAEPASAASAPSVASVTGMTRRSVARASQMLRFDQFFAPQAEGTPTPLLEDAPTVKVVPGPADTPGTSTAGSATPEATATPEAAAAPTGDADDLDQFQDWLKGLAP